MWCKCLLCCLMSACLMSAVSRNCLSQPMNCPDHSCFWCACLDQGLRALDGSYTYTWGEICAWGHFLCLWSHCFPGIMKPSPLGYVDHPSEAQSMTPPPPIGQQVSRPNTKGYLIQVSFNSLRLSDSVIFCQAHVMLLNGGRPKE